MLLVQAWVAGLVPKCGTVLRGHISPPAYRVEISRQMPTRTQSAPIVPQRAKCGSLMHLTRPWPLQTCVNFSFRKSAWAGTDVRVAQLKSIARKLQIEKRGLSFFKLAASGYHIVGLPRSFCHGHIDHHTALKRTKRLAHALAICQRMNGIGTFDEHRPKALGMLCQNFIRNHIAWN